MSGFARKVGAASVLLLVIAASLLNGCGSQSAMPTPAPPAVTLTTLTPGLTNPVDLQQPNDASGRLFVVEQPGTIRIFQNGALTASPFLDIRSKVNFGGEMGLLGLAFHPNFRQSGRFFVHYDRMLNGQVQSVIAEYRVSTADPNQADAATERILLTVDQPFTNHKGGQLAFGPDNFLYIGLGDGGSEDDPLGNGQKLQTLLGKMLRIDVDAADPGKQYRVPPDNPLVAGGGLAEIWAFGLRNPWRFSFDRDTGRLFCADVGQDRFEEIDLIQRGGNFGWSIMEAAHCFNPMSGCSMSGLILPIAEYDHSEGNAVIGGYVYHGASIPQLQQAYIMGDFGSGKIWELREDQPGKFTRILLLATGRNISSFGQDQSGEVYVLDYAGSLLKLAPQ